MEKQEFIKKLRSELRWQLESKELGKVLREYEEYFDKAAAEGRNAAEVSAELGEPSLVATEILSERYGGEMAKKRATTGLAFAFVILAFTLYTYTISPYIGNARYFFENSNAGSLNIIQLLVLTPTVLAFLVFPRIKGSHPTAVSKLAIANISACAVGALCFIISFQSIFLAINSLDKFAAHPIGGKIEMLPLGPLINNILLITALVVVGFIAATLLKIFHGGVMAIPLLYLNCTCLLATYKYTQVLRQMSDLANFSAAVHQVALQVALGLAITCASFVLLRLLLNKRIPR